MRAKISATELGRGLSAVLHRDRRQGHSCLIEQDSEAVATLEPLGAPRGVTWRTSDSGASYSTGWRCRFCSRPGRGPAKPAENTEQRVAQLIDTSVFIAIERQQLNLDLLARSFPDEPIALAVITASELIAGVYDANTEERRHCQAFVERILTTLAVIPFDLSAAHVYAGLMVDLRKSGQTIGARDLQIAATALSSGFEVTTHNVRDFGRVPGLGVRQIEPNT